MVGLHKGGLAGGALGAKFLNGASSVHARNVVRVAAAARAMASSGAAPTITLVQALILLVRVGARLGP